MGRPARLLEAQNVQRRCGALSRLRDSLRAECLLTSTVHEAASTQGRGAPLRALPGPQRQRLQPLDDERLGASAAKCKPVLPKIGDRIKLRSGEVAWVRSALGHDADSDLAVDFRDGVTTSEQVGPDDYVRCGAPAPSLPRTGDRVTLRTGERAWVLRTIGDNEDAALEVDFRDGRTSREHVGADQYLRCGSRFT